MPELRKDPVTGRWVIISTDRQKRPHDFRFERAAVIGREHCPFCPGHEALTPPEVISVSLPVKNALRWRTIPVSRCRDLAVSRGCW